MTWEGGGQVSRYSQEGLCPGPCTAELLLLPVQPSVPHLRAMSLCVCPGPPHFWTLLKIPGIPRLSVGLAVGLLPGSVLLKAGCATYVDTPSTRMAKG